MCLLWSINLFYPFNKFSTKSMSCKILNKRVQFRLSKAFSASRKISAVHLLCYSIIFQNVQYISNIIPQLFLGKNPHWFSWINSCNTIVILLTKLIINNFSFYSSSDSISMTFRILKWFLMHTLTIISWKSVAFIRLI